MVLQTGCCVAVLLCCRRWGHFPLLSRLRAVSAKRRKLPHPAPQLAAVDEAGGSAADTAADVFQQFDCLPDSPTGNWMQLLKQKKKARDEGIAHMIRVQHAVLVIQVCLTCNGRPMQPGSGHDHVGYSA